MVTMGAVARFMPAARVAEMPLASLSAVSQAIALLTLDFTRLSKIHNKPAAGFTPHSQYAY